MTKALSGAACGPFNCIVCWQLLEEGKKRDRALDAAPEVNVSVLTFGRNGTHKRLFEGEDRASSSDAQAAAPAAEDAEGEAESKKRKGRLSTGKHLYHIGPVTGT